MKKPPRPGIDFFTTAGRNGSTTLARSFEPLTFGRELAAQLATCQAG
jgi:hypothetical protein